MKKAWAAVLAAGCILLTGCRAGQPQAAGPADGAVKPAEIQVMGAGSGRLGPISQGAVSQAVRDALRGEWDSWNQLSWEQQMVSSHFPGWCTRDFGGWAECEGFLGFSIPNPLEECGWLEKATYVGMPEGFRGAPNAQASWYGTRDGHVEWISLSTGYRSGEVRVAVSATVYGDPAEAKLPDQGWGTELARQDYLAGADAPPFRVTSDDTERYSSSLAYYARGPVLYCLNIVGEPGGREQVESTLGQVMAAFGQQAG